MSLARQDSSLVVEQQPSSSTQDTISILQDKTLLLKNQYDRLNIDLLGEIERLLASIPESGVDPTRHTGRDYVSAISLNNACQHYLQYYVEFQGLVRNAEKAVRVAQRSLKLEQGPARLEHMSEAVELVRQCMSYMHAMEKIEQRVDVKEVSAGLYSRACEAGRQARSIISARIQHCLKDSHWPPPLLPSSSEKHSWNGFEQAGDDVFLELQQLIVMMITLQMAVEHQSFSNLDAHSADDIVLWPAIEFSGLIQSWIGSHFAPNMPTCKMEKPEWLFSAVHYAVRICSSYVDIFEPCIEAHGIQNHFSMGIDIGKSVYMDGLYKVVKGVYLPLIFEEQDASYVLHYVDEAIKFETKYRPLRVDPLMASELNRYSHKKSMIEILFENGDWAAQWMNYEGEEARRRIYGVASDPAGWKSNTETHDTIASLHEFHPCRMIINATEIVIDLLDKTKYIHAGSNKLLWCDSVVRVALDTLTSHMQSELTRTEQFEHLIDDIGMPIISGSLNGLHYLEHVMTEPTGMLLETFVSSPEVDTFLDKRANAFSLMRRKWTNKIVSMSMKSIFWSFLQLAGEEQPGEEQGPSPKIIRLRNHISTLLNEFSRHVDQVIFREIWKGIALSTSESFLADIQTAKLENISKMSLKENLNILVSAFSSFTNKPEAYFRPCFDALQS